MLKNHNVTGCGKIYGDVAVKVVIIILISLLNPVSIGKVITDNAYNM